MRKVIFGLAMMAGCVEVENISMRPLEISILCGSDDFCDYFILGDEREFATGTCIVRKCSEIEARVNRGIYEGNTLSLDGFYIENNGNNECKFVIKTVYIDGLEL